jgi:macrolide transport system ATP-binding/permease protein
MTEPLLKLENVWREYPSGDETIAALKGINLEIQAGEMVAIVGASGSGKSTLMNILGCLDRPTRGSYRVRGELASELRPDDLARLRREYFGFIFQRYHLLTNLSATGNVELPAVYSGADKKRRRERALDLLQRMGLGPRADHHPNQLSGGQQQRVSIARALMNGGDVLLADEPTGALDQRSGQEMMKILHELHEEGHTIIIVTHDMQVAQHADRIIEISDGEIVADRRKETAKENAVLKRPETPLDGRWRAEWGRFLEAFKMAILAMRAHGLRTFLTMLGIIIGIASVVSVIALGAGTKAKILDDIRSIGTNTINIYPGGGFGDTRAARVQTMKIADVDALGELPYVDSITPTISISVVASLETQTSNVSVNGVGEEYFRVKGMDIGAGKSFDKMAVKRIAQEVVIDSNTKATFFPNGENPIGRILLLGTVPCQIVGVIKKKETAFGVDENLNVYVPYTATMYRFAKQTFLRNVTIRIADAVSTDAAEQGITRMLTQRHGTKDFYVSNSDSIRQTIDKTSSGITMLISSIALISLVVGGIGVMNIMLVSVTERTHEIGVRMAVGARQRDIMNQFLIESVLVCLIGGVIGIGLVFVINLIIKIVGTDFNMVISVASILMAFSCSSLIGVLFGFLPAKNAARLDPVEALSRE